MSLHHAWVQRLPSNRRCHVVELGGQLEYALALCGQQLTPFEWWEMLGDEPAPPHKRCLRCRAQWRAVLTQAESPV
jgi:hypothetical protein